MKENITACINELADWYLKNRSELDGREIGAIIRRNCKSTFDEYYIRDYLASEQGKLQFKTALLEKIRKVPSDRILSIPDTDWGKARKTKAWENFVREWGRSYEWDENEVQLRIKNANIRDFFEDVDEVAFRNALIKELYPDHKPSNLLTTPVENDSCQRVPPQYRDLLPFLEGYPSGSFLIEESTSTGTAKIDAILQKLKDGVTAIQDSSLFREYLLTMSKFWSYSIGNLILIMLQKPDASRVAGFNTWRELGRFVKAGEHGISILAPCLPPKSGYEYWVKGDAKYSTRYLNGEWFIYIDSKQSEGPYRSKVDTEAELIHRGFSKVKEQTETYESPRYFKVVYVFDISQTSGKELPVIEVRSLTGAANPELWEKMLALLKRKNVNVSFESRPSLNERTKGQFLMPNNIWIRPEEPTAQQLKTIIHETGHYYTENVFRIPQSDAETIAESVAFVVGAHFGFDSGTRSFPYVAVWSQDKKVLEKNLASIKSISSSILSDMEVKESV